MPPEKTDPLEERVLRRIPFEIVAFVWLKQSLTRVLSREKKGALRSGILLHALRIVLICAVFFLIIVVYPKKIIAFVAGFSSVVPIVLVEGVRGLLLMRTWKD